MHLIIEHKVKRPYAHTLFRQDGLHAPQDIVDMWMAHITGDDDYDDLTFIITPDPADAKSVGMEHVIGDLELMRIDEIGSILILG